MSWTALSQDYTHDEYCLPLSKARLVIQDALRYKAADSLANLLEARVGLLESQNLAQYHSFSNLLQIEQQKFTTQKEITANMEGLTNSFREERDYYQKQDRKHRRQNKLLAGLLVGVVILVVGK